MKNKRGVRIAGSVMHLMQLVVLFLPFYQMNTLVQIILGLRPGEAEDVTVQSISQLADILRDQGGVTSVDVIRLPFCGNFHNLADVVNGVKPDQFESGLIVVVSLCFVLPLIVRLLGGILGLACKSKVSFIVCSAISFLLGTGVLIGNWAYYQKLQEQLSEWYGGQLSVLQSTMAAVGNSADIASYFVSPGIGFYMTYALSAVSFILAVVCGVKEKKPVRKPKTASQINSGRVPKPMADGAPIQNGGGIPQPMAGGAPVQNGGGMPQQVPTVQKQTDLDSKMPEPIRPGDIKGVLYGIAGLYAGAEISLREGPIIMGRDAARVNLVFDDSCSKVSRRHCELSYNPEEKMFTIVDYSSTGTFKNGSSNCLPQNMKIPLEPGVTIDIGDETNRFRLM